MSTRPDPSSTVAADPVSQSLKIVSVVGARPQFVKLAPIASAAREAGVEHIVIHTGQHYDDNMSQSFFDELGIPSPDVNLGVGSAGHGRQTGQMLIELEPIFENLTPDWVLVYGDTNSTLAAAVCATKLHLPLAHLEAGLRSFNRSMPEEHNRVLTDHSADLCLAPTQTAMHHLQAEGLAQRSVLVGDVMTDVLFQVRDRVSSTPVLSPVEGSDFILATLHRPQNTDDPARLKAVIEALASIPHQVYLAAHPRLVAAAQRSGIALERGAITVVPPLSYPQLVQALSDAKAVVTDSGGLQKEAFLMGVPVTTVRTETEWVETLEYGWNQLQFDPTAIAATVLRAEPVMQASSPYGDGTAAHQVIRALREARP